MFLLFLYFVYVPIAAVDFALCRYSVGLPNIGLADFASKPSCRTVDVAALSTSPSVELSVVCTY